MTGKAGAISSLPPSVPPLTNSLLRYGDKVNMSFEMSSALTFSHNEQGVVYAESVAASANVDPFEDGEEDDDDDEDDELQLPERLTKNGRRRALSFPLKLVKVLSMKTYSGVVEWTPSGKAFKILDTDRFESEVMATHFKSSKFSSFLRKLRRWGYVRLYRGPDSGTLSPFIPSIHCGHANLTFLPQEPTTTDNSVATVLRISRTWCV